MNLPNISFPGEKIKFITPTWDDMNDLAFQISQKMIQAGKKFDRIVTLAKGGWPMTRSLVDFLEVGQVASLGIKFYSGVNQRFVKPKIYQDFPVSLKGEQVLLFDDVADTGESFKFTKSHLLKNNVRSITTASLFYKPHSIFKPDFYGYKTDAWIIFPYEKVETMKFLINKWQSRHLPQSLINSRLCKLLGKKIVAGIAS
ncbi:MAG: phosphoribosyltransferase [Candidatus Beckwithbacteria bacterium]|nr:phosphoribosyltransferase [Candidatus Beckwithbacteria bacterium]